jgi:predicted amidohydrolase
MNSKLLRVEENVDRALHFLERTRADLMVLPELFNTGYNFSTRREGRRANPKWLHESEAS